MGNVDGPKKLQVLHGGSSRQEREDTDPQEFANLLELYDKQDQPSTPQKKKTSLIAKFRTLE